ncbi:MAG: glycine cleavage system aminomethyltransferase GcvT [Pyrinomonadaceae bacterium]
MTELKQTPLNMTHRRMKANMVDFGGWDMPIQYPAGVIEEHLRTRKAAGLFDVSHMGEIEVRGVDAINFVNYICSNDVTKLVDGQAHYTSFTTQEGTVVDDLLVYRFAEDHLLLIVNASTTEKDWDWISTHKKGRNVEIRNSSADYCQLAVQGPHALGILQSLTPVNLAEIKYYHFTTGKVCDVQSIISRTGYTGEDGFEVYAAPERAELLWNKILDAGKFGTDGGIIPCGLAARNTLRLEAAMALYGHEIDETTTLLEAGLGWICKLNKGDFIGRDALLKQKETGIKRKLVGFEVTGRGIARDGQDVFIQGEKIGHVTSAGPAPFLKKNIGMAYVPVEIARQDQEIEIDVRGKLVAARIVATPFYKRAKR